MYGTLGVRTRAGAIFVRHEYAGKACGRGAVAEVMQTLQPVRDAEVLVRFQNNLKIRALQRGENARAIEIAQWTVLAAPGRPELWVDLAHLNENHGALEAARKAYEACLMLTKTGSSLHNEAALGLQGLKRRLN